MKKLSIIIGFLLFSFSIYSQEVSVKFSTLESEANEKYEEKGFLIHKIELKITGIDIKNDFTFFIKKLETSTAKETDFKIITKSITIQEVKFSKKDTLIEDIYVEIFHDTLQEKDEVFIIVLETNDTILNKKSKTQQHIVTIINAEKPENKENPFYFALGWNFDYLNKSKLTDLYAEFTVFQPDLIWSRVGFDVGLYQNMNVSIDSSATNVLFEKELSTDLTMETISVLREHYDIKTTKSFHNTGLYLSPLFRIKDDLNKSGYGLNLYLSLHLEVYKQVITRNVERTFIDSVTVKVLSTSFTEERPPYSSYRNYTNTYYKKHFGIGLPIYYNSKFGEIYIKPAVGFLWSENDFSVENGFYIVQFNVIEKATGISIGGSYRGIFGGESLMQIHLAKKINLSKLLENK